MPLKTGGSHAISAFVSLLIGTALSKYVWTYTPPLAEAGRRVGSALTLVTGTPVSRELAGTIVVVVGLSFLWGVVYHLGRHS